MSLWKRWRKVPSGCNIANLVLLHDILYEISCNASMKDCFLENLRKGWICAGRVTSGGCAIHPGPDIVANRPSTPQVKNKNFWWRSYEGHKIPQVFWLLSYRYGWVPRPNCNLASSKNDFFRIMYGRLPTDLYFQWRYKLGYHKNQLWTSVCVSSTLSLGGKYSGINDLDDEMVRCIEGGIRAWADILVDLLIFFIKDYKNYLL